MGRIRAVIDWLDDRTGLRALARHALDEAIPGGARLRYVFGSVLTFLFLQQVVLGVLLASYYSPSVTDAWASTAYLQDRVTAGWFLRGLHHHGASAMVIVLVLHVGQVLLAGAYRKPREVNWWTGLLMGSIVLAFALTGYLLPWDQKGYWATQVATGILGSVPLVGETAQQLLQGGSRYGNLTVTRFYAVHVFVLPALLGGLLVAHIALFRRHGVTPPAGMGPAELARKQGRFWPEQLFRDVSAMAVTSLVLVVVTLRTHGAELYAPADPASSFVARPEWYFLFLFQLLKYFEGPMQIVATVVLPGAAAVFLAALPFVDRAPSLHWRKRWPVLGAVGLGMSGVVTLTALALVEDARNESFQRGQALAVAQGERARELAREGVLPEGGDAVWRNDPSFAAIVAFREHCAACHRLDGVTTVGAEDAPNLTGFSSRAWLAGAIRNPRSPAYFGGTKGHDEMEAYPPEVLPDAQLEAVVEYLMSLRGDEAITADAALAERGRALWDGELECSGCHEVQKGKGGGAPNFDGRGTQEWIARVIANSSAKDLYEDGAEMPEFATKLSEDAIAGLAELVHRQGLN